MKQIIDHLSCLLKTRFHRGYSIESESLVGGAEVIYLQRFGNPAFAVRFNELETPEVLIVPSPEVASFANEAIAFIQSQQKAPSL